MSVDDDKKSCSSCSYSSSVMAFNVKTKLKRPNKGYNMGFIGCLRLDNRRPLQRGTELLAIGRLRLIAKNGNVKRKTKNKSFFGGNFHSSTRIGFVGRAKQSFRRFGQTTFV